MYNRAMGESETVERSPAVYDWDWKPEVLSQLREGFPAGAISKLPRGGNGEPGKCNVCSGWHKPGAIHLDYVGHAEVTDRLLTVDPTWTWEPVAWENGRPALEYDKQSSPVGLWIWLYVAGVRRLGYGSCAPGKGDAVKELIGDAIRNAAMRFGVALNLWSKSELESNLGEEPTAPARPAPADTKDVKVASKKDRDALVKMFDQIPEVADEEKPRLVAKHQFKEAFGAPDRLPADKLGEAKAWIEEQIAKHSQPDGPLTQTPAGKGEVDASDSPGSPAPASPTPPQTVDRDSYMKGVLECLEMVSDDERKEFDKFVQTKVGFKGDTLDDLSDDQLVAVWHFLNDPPEGAQ